MDHTEIAAALMRVPPLSDPTGELIEPIYHLVVCESVLREIIAVLLNEPVPLSKGRH
jgi:hypothetical protein